MFLLFMFMALPIPQLMCYIFKSWFSPMGYVPGMNMWNLSYMSESGLIAGHRWFLKVVLLARIFMYIGGKVGAPGWLQAAIYSVPLLSPQSWPQLDFCSDHQAAPSCVLYVLNWLFDGYVNSCPIFPTSEQIYGVLYIICFHYLRPTAKVVYEGVPDGMRTPTWGAISVSTSMMIGLLMGLFHSSDGFILRGTWNKWACLELGTVVLQPLLIAIGMASLTFDMSWWGGTSLGSYVFSYFFTGQIGVWMCHLCDWLAWDPTGLLQFAAVAASAFLFQSTVGPAGNYLLLLPARKASAGHVDADAGGGAPDAGPLASSSESGWSPSLTVFATAYVVMLVAMHVGFVALEGVAPVTCLYVVTQIVTTVGYGDITPQSHVMMVFVALFTIMTFVCFAYVANLLVQMATSRQGTVMKEVLNTAGRLCDVHNTLRQDRLSAEYRKLGKSTLVFLSFVLFGTLFYSTLEDCSCSYGVTAIEGCDGTDYSTCVQTKGATKSLSEAFYFSVITLTTVGFGDFTPESRVGRWVSIVWMIFGVCATATWVASMSSFLFEHETAKKQADAPSAEDLFGALDADHDGYLSRAEHHVYLLRQQGVLSDSMLKSLDEHFDTLDLSARGVVDVQQMHERSAVSGETASECVSQNGTRSLIVAAARGRVSRILTPRSMTD